MKPVQLLFIAILSAFLITACEKDPQDPPFLNTDKTSLNFSSVQDWDTLIVTSNVPWKISMASPDTGWSAMPGSGEPGTTMVFVHVNPNFTNAPRSGSLTVASTGAVVDPVLVNIVQDPSFCILSFDARGRGGDTIRIEGQGYSPVPSQNVVTINGQLAAIKSASPTKLVVFVPQKAGSGKIKLTVSGKTLITGKDFNYDWVALVSTVAGSTAGYADGTGTAAKFLQPAGIRLDAAGNILVADIGNSKVRKISPSGVVTSLPGRLPANPPYNTAFAGPSDIVLDPSGNIFVVENGGNAISRIAPDGTVSLFAGGLAGSDDGTGTAAKFLQPSCIAIDAAGNMYVSDNWNQRIRKITPGAVVSTLAGNTQGYADGTGNAAKFDDPTGITTDASGNIYVADRLNHRIRKITPAGVVTTLAGSGTDGFHDGAPLSAKFQYPHAITTDAAGILYVTEASRIRVIPPAGNTSSVVEFIDNATGSPMLVNGIRGIAVDATGTIYFSLQNWHRIFKVTALQ